MPLNLQAEEWLMKRAAQASPLEACGLILEGNEIVEISNISLSPTRGFRMDRNEMVEKLGTRAQFITGIWHTHPRGSIHPSRTDLNGIKCGAIQVNWEYYIVTASSVNKYETKLYAPQDMEFWSKFTDW